MLCIKMKTWTKMDERLIESIDANKVYEGAMHGFNCMKSCERM
jgi:hypothetical protein